MKTTLIGLFCVALYFSPNAQYSWGSLQYNNIDAQFTTAGLLFGNVSVSNPVAGYEFPSGSGMNEIFTSGLYFGGTDTSGQTRLSVSTFYADKELFPGPYSSTGDYLSAGYDMYNSPAYWFVSQTTINDHLQTYNLPGYTPSPEIAQWPANGDQSIGIAQDLAPYIDVNNDGYYNPYDGDFPDIRGDRAVYIIMNDDAKAHTEVGTEALGIEVHVMLYQYATNDYLNDQTFMNVRVFNRGDMPYQDFVASVFMDFDIGYYADDYCGSDSQRSMIFGYNGDANDENNAGILGYGATPACAGFRSLTTPAASAGYFTNGAVYPYADPSNTVEYWNLMNGTWADGSQWVYGGLGYVGSPGATTTPTSFLFDGNPNAPSEWSEYTNANIPGDRRALLNMPSEVFNPGDMLCYDYAVISDMQSDYLSNVNNMMAKSDLVKSFFDAQNFACNQVTAGVHLPEANDFALYPNPASGKVVVQLPSANEVRLQVTNFAGQTVYDATHASQLIGLELDEPAGVYFVSVSDGSGRVVKKLVLN